MTQMPMFQPASDWRTPNLSELPSWADAKRVCVDVETKDPQLKKLGPGVRRDGEIVGVAFQIEDGPGAYLPIRHQGGDNLPVDRVLAYLRDQARVFKGDLCGSNLSYDLDFLAEEGIKFTPRYFRDAMVADVLCNELQESYGLDAMAQRHGLPGKDEVLLCTAAEEYRVDPKFEMWKLPARYVGRYAQHDTVIPLQILRRCERIIEEQNLWQIYNLESKVLPILVEMRRWGVRINLEQLDRVEAWSINEEKRHLDDLYRETNIRIKPGDIEQKGPVAQALENIGVKLAKTPTGQPKIDKNTLANIDHPVAKMLSRIKKVVKLRTTFVESIRKHLIGDRIHCSFNQMAMEDEKSGGLKGARFGRLSSTDPNLQQQPSRDDFSKMWRAIYVPDHEGQVWACCDYSQQEPRLTVHYAEKINAPGAALMGNRYRENPNTDNHTAMAQIIYGLGPDEEPTKAQRNNAKIVFLGLCYGMGGAKLARDLGLDTKWVPHSRTQKLIEVAGDEAQSILDQFNFNAPFVKYLSKACMTKAEQRGYITTLLGRRCRFPKLDGGGYDWTYKALNRLIQGSAADQTKQALVSCHEAGFTPQLQVHDELDRSCDNREEAEEMGNIMRHCVELAVPAKVDVEVGPSWGEVK